MMEPPPASIILGMAAFIMRNGPVRLTSSCLPPDRRIHVDHGRVVLDRRVVHQDVQAGR